MPFFRTSSFRSKISFKKKQASQDSLRSNTSETSKQSNASAKEEPEVNKVEPISGNVLILSVYFTRIYEFLAKWRIFWLSFRTNLNILMVSDINCSKKNGKSENLIFVIIFLFSLKIFQNISLISSLFMVIKITVYINKFMFDLDNS